MKAPIFEINDPVICKSNNGTPTYIIGRVISKITECTSTEVNNTYKVSYEGNYVDTFDECNLCFIDEDQVNTIRNAFGNIL